MSSELLSLFLVSYAKHEEVSALKGTQRLELKQLATVLEETNCRYHEALASAIG